MNILKTNEKKFCILITGINAFHVRRLREYLKNVTNLSFREIGKSNNRGLYWETVDTIATRRNDGTISSLTENQKAVIQDIFPKTPICLVRHGRTDDGTLIKFVIPTK